MSTKERFCCYCGDSLGVIESRYYDRTDTCGKRECERAIQDDQQREREEAHDRLDESPGY